MDDPSEEGGDPACWAHLLDEEGVTVADLAGQLAEPGDGVHWTLTGGTDLNANLVRLDADHAIETHSNAEVDVLLVTMAGTGHLVLATRTIPLAPATVVHLPRGSERSIHAGPDGLAYLTVHRRRGPLEIGRRPPT